LGTAINRPAPHPIALEDFLETTSDAVFALDRNLTIQCANTKALAFWGLTAPECNGQSVASVFPELAGSDILRGLQSTLADGGSCAIETMWPGRASHLDLDIHATRSGLLVYFRDFSVRLGIARQVRQRHEALDLAESSSGIGVWDTDLKTQTVRGTDQFFRIMGLQPMTHAVPMETMRGLRVPEDQARLAEQYERAIATGADFFESEYRIVRPDGQMRWIFGRGRVVRDAAGIPVRYSGVDIDITEKKAADAALRESEDRFSHVFEQSPLGKAMAGPDFRLRAVNPALCEMLGYEAEELAGRPFTGFVHPGDLETFLTSGRALVQGEVSQIQLEARFVAKGGAPLWVRVTVGPIRDADGNLVHMLAILQDIDENRRVVQALRESEERLRNLNETLEQQAEERARQLASSRAQLQAFFDNSPDWLTLIKGTPDGRFIFVDINPTSEIAYGLPREQVIGRTVEEILGHEPAQTPLRYFRECLRTGVSRYSTTRTMAGHTSAIDVMAVLVPGPDNEGNKFIITTARDMTEREGIEAQLRQAQKMEAVGHLTGGIAHDFNNLLTAISGSLELLQKRMEDGRTADAPRYIAAARTAANRAAALTHRLLAFARRQPLDPVPLDANLLIGSMEDLLQRTLGPSVDLRLISDDGLWAVLCDRNQLEAAILNLAINARDVMPDGGQLIVRTENLRLDEAWARHEATGTKAGDYVAVSVTDTGSGMPPEVAARAFEPFFTTKPQGKGTGLGLSMLYGFVQQSGGHVRIESDVGMGTTVRMYLPRHGAGAANVVPVRDAGATPGHYMRAEAGKTVLVIEDEAPIRQMIGGVLTELGYTVIEAHDGPSALRLLEAADDLDLLVTDVGLPGGLNGRQVAEAARERRPGLRVLFITGFSYNSELGRGDALDHGMELMRKPFTLDAFAAKVNELISLASA
jgi:PAS domain S-box-containing protein